MRTTSKISFVIALSTLLLSCEKDTITASSEITIKDYEFSGYTSLEVNQ